MTDVHRSATTLDPPVWTLVVEMRMALVFPLLVAMVKRFGWPGVAVSLVVAFVCSKAKAALGDPSTMVAESVAGAFLMTLRYVVFFLLGIIAAARLEQHKRFLGRIPAGRQTAAVVGVVFVLGFLIFKKMLGDGYIDTMFGLFAVYLITLCAGFPRVAAKLSGRVCLWLGDTSYSLYLIHMPVMLAIFCLLYGRASYAVTVTIAFPLILLAGHFTHCLIERPSMNLGRKAAKVLRSS